MTVLIAVCYSERTTNMNVLTDVICLVFLKDKRCDFFDCCHFLWHSERTRNMAVWTAV